MELLMIVFGLLAVSDVARSCGLSSACCKSLESKVDTLTDAVEHWKDAMGSRNAAGGVKTTSAAVTTTSAAVTTVDPRIECSSLSGMMHENICYFPLEDQEDFDAALSACQNVPGATMASVTTVQLYDALEPFLRKVNVAEGSDDIAWGLGMTYDPDFGGRDVTTLDGTTVTWNGKWYGDAPKTTADTLSAQSWRVVKMDVNIHPDDYNGFWNSPKNMNNRPVCMI